MGLFSKKWECANCGKKYRNEPTECKKCGHTVYNKL